MMPRRLAVKLQHITCAAHWQRPSPLSSRCCTNFSRLPGGRRWSSNTSGSPLPHEGSAAGAGSNSNRLGGHVVLGTLALLGLGFVVGLAAAELDTSGVKHSQRDLRLSDYPLIPPYATRTKQLDAAMEIAHLLGDRPDAVSYDPDVLEHHGHSDWSTSNSANRAVAVVYPRTTAEVTTIARVCSAYNCPMVPFGAGSSVEGNFSQPYGGICVDFCLMDKIVAFRPDDMDVVVQPGVNWVDLNEHVKNAGLFAPLDPSPTATIGGMVSTNCSGTNAMRYGTMKDWVISLTVVLPDGEVIRTRRRPRKTSAGYNLTSLFVGAEGTLGFVTEITLKLAPIPQDTSVAAVSFPTIKNAATAASLLIRSGIQLAALELMDDVQMRILNEHGSEAVRKTKWEETATLFIKFSGTTEGIKSDVGRATQIIKPFTTPGRADNAFHFARTKQEEADIWAARKEALFTMVGIKPEGYEMWSTDVAVPISRLAEIVELSKKECGQLGLFCSVIGHVGDGNFHVAMMYDPRREDQKEAVARCVKNMMARALEMDGTVSGEHAIGIGKKECLVDELGEETIWLMRRIKRVVDPGWIMNPGKVFDPYPKRWRDRGNSSPR